MKLIKWHTFVKVWEYSDDPAPYYMQWVAWCWRKPIWIGLPLVVLVAIPMIADALLGIVYILSRWGRKEASK